MIEEIASRRLLGRNPGHVHRKARGIDALANVSCNLRVTQETISLRCLNHGVSQDSYVHAVLPMEYHKTRIETHMLLKISNYKFSLF